MLAILNFLWYKKFKGGEKGEERGREILTSLAQLRFSSLKMRASAKFKF